MARIFVTYSHRHGRSACDRNANTYRTCPRAVSVHGQYISRRFRRGHWWYIVGRIPEQVRITCQEKSSLLQQELSARNKWKRTLRILSHFCSVPIKFSLLRETGNSRCCTAEKKWEKTLPRESVEWEHDVSRKEKSPSSIRLLALSFKYGIDWLIVWFVRSKESKRHSSLL